MSVGGIQRIITHKKNSFISFIRQFNSLPSGKITESCNRKGVKQKWKKRLYSLFANDHTVLYVEYDKRLTSISVTLYEFRDNENTTNNVHTSYLRGMT
jgi:hypothetical protein